MAGKYRSRKPRARRAPRRKTGVKTAIRKQKTKVFNARVKKAVSTMIETKAITVRSNNSIVAFTGANWAACDSANVIQFDPVINQGTGLNQRSGNIITMKSCYMRYMITLNAASGIYPSIPQLVKVVFFYDRADVNSVPTPFNSQNFIDNNNASQGFAGNLTDVFYRYNEDRYRILGSRTHKLGFASATGLNSDNTQQFYANNDSHMFIIGKVDCSDWVIKKQKFNDNLGTAETRKLYCLVYTTPQNGATWPSGTPSPCVFRYEIDYKYTDA